jgi:hypothetical protein
MMQFKLGLTLLQWPILYDPVYAIAQSALVYPDTRYPHT